MKFVNAQDNYIASVNFTSLLLKLPKIKVLDLQHYLFNCEIINVTIEVLSDCGSTISMGSTRFVSTSLTVYIGSTASPSSTLDASASFASTTTPVFFSSTPVFTEYNDTRLTAAGSWHFGSCPTLPCFFHYSGFLCSAEENPETSSLFPSVFYRRTRPVY